MGHVNSASFQANPNYRSSALGKVHLERHGKRIIEACRIQGVEPYVYLKETLERRPTATNQTFHLPTPRPWAEAQAAKAAENR